MSTTLKPCDKSTDEVKQFDLSDDQQQTLRQFPPNESETPPEGLAHEQDSSGQRLILVVVFPDRTELIERTDSDRRERLCEAHRRSARVMGVIQLTASGTFTADVLAPYSECAAKRYLERIARDIAVPPRAGPAIAS
jgi:hypothetical protein